MNPLLYSSNEMFSSTELIRKSKMIFDKLLKSEIEKAIILRDGKPGFMLLDFEEYEKLMKEYLELKENASKVVVQEVETKETEIIEEIEKEKPSQKLEEKQESDEVGFSMQTDLADEPSLVVDDISEDDLKKALEDIESLGLDDKKEEKLDEDDLNELSFQRK